MPIAQQPPERPQVDLENTPFRFGPQPISDDRALTIVRETFNKWSRARQANHDDRWMANDRLYLGVVEQKFWGDKKTKRANLGVPIAFDQVESVYPIITRSLFGRQDWVGVEPTIFSTAQEARALGDAMLYQLSTAQDVSGMCSLQHLKLAVRELLIHGFGVMELGFRQDTGNTFAEWVPLKDFYFDPQMGWPNIDRATMVIVKKRMTVEQLESLRGLPGYKIPSAAILASFKNQTGTTPGDRLEDHLRAVRHSNGGRDYNPDPAKQFIDVYQAWTDNRVIWTLNNRFTCLNEENPYGFKAFVAGSCTILPGETMGPSMPDMLEGEQMLIQGVTNASIDKLSLELFPPRYRMPMGGQSPYQEAWKPGMIADIRDPKGVEVLFPPSSGSDAFQHLALAERRAQRRFGVSEMAQAGTPTPSNANRTAGGVRSQEAATSSRIGTIIENVEDYIIVPMLYKLQAIMEKFVPQSIPQIPAMGKNGEQLVPRSILSRPVRFKMSGASNLASRAELLQIMTPVSQMLLSEPVMKAVAQQGKTIDVEEWSRFFLDATTGQRYAFFRPMTPEEQQAQQQPSPDVMMEMQKVQMEGQIRQSIMQQKVEGELEKTRMQEDAAGDRTGEESARKLVELVMKGDTERGKSLMALAAKKEDKKGGSTA